MKYFIVKRFKRNNYFFSIFNLVIKGQILEEEKNNSIGKVWNIREKLMKQIGEWNQLCNIKY